MNKFSCLLGTLTLTAGFAAGCSVDAPTDPFSTLTTTATATASDTNADADTDAEEEDTIGSDDDVGTEDDESTTGETGETETGDDATSDSGCTPGTFNCPCDNGECNDNLECDDQNICGVPSGDSEETTDTTTTGGLGMCDPDDIYCIDNACAETEPPGQSLVVDIDMDDMPDFGWCLFDCVVDMDCPAHPAAGVASCIEYAADSFGCVLNCDVNDPNSCAPGSECSTAAGPALCFYDL